MIEDENEILAHFVARRQAEEKTKSFGIESTKAKLTSEDVAKMFHYTYEELAPQYGYITRKDTRMFDPTSGHGKLMIEVCRMVLEKLRNG